MKTIAIFLIGLMCLIVLFMLIMECIVYIKRKIKHRRIHKEYKARLRQSEENVRLVNEYIKKMKT
jgi:hypothetical protein